MQKTLGLLLMFVGVTSVAMGYFDVPEIDPTSGASALALISGALLILRSRR